MPNVVLQLPAIGEDPHGEKILAAFTALADAVNNANGAAAPQPLGPVAVAGTASGPSAAANHVHANTGLATLQDLEDAVVGAGGVPAARQVVAGTGLTGGGTLELDRTLAVVFGDTAGTAVEGNDARLDGAVVGETEVDSPDDPVLTVRLAGDPALRFLVRADGTLGHGDPPVSVSDVTGTSTVTVTTAADHNVGTGDVVTITGVGGFTGANGTFTVTRTGDTTVTLDGATGSGTYTTGGLVQRVLGGTGSDLEGVWNLAGDATRDPLVVRGHASGTGNGLLVRGPLGGAEAALRTDGTVRVRGGDAAGGSGVLALGDATTVPTVLPDGTHDVAGDVTVAGVVVWSADGRPFVRTSAGHEDQLLAPVRRHTASLSAPGGDSTLVVTGTLPPTVATANVTAAADDQASGPMVGYATSAASGVDAGVVTPFGVVQRRWAPHLHAKVMTDAAAVTSTRLWVGLTSAELGGLTADPTTQHVAAFRYDSGLDGTAYWRTVTCGGSAATVTTTTAAIAANTAYELAIEINSAGTAARFWVDGALVATHTTNIPGTSTALGCIARLRTLAAASRELRLGRITWSRL